MNPSSYNTVETVLLQNIDKPNSCFIFPTDIASSRWADHLLRIKGGSIAMNKFIAWDVFKQNSIKSKVKNKTSIPSALRKIFVSRLIKENAEAGKTPVFNSLIKPEWAGQASQFTSWLTAVLPQLGDWIKKAAGLSIHDFLSQEKKPAQNFIDDCNQTERDLITLAERYSQYLNECSLFEPAWETPPFNDDGSEYFIFFPHSLSDYSEYKHLLESSPHVRIINAEKNEKPCDSFFYTNSRREIIECSLYIRALHEKSKINWDSIAVCIPDSQDYEPYLVREFQNRNIPFVKRISKPLCDYPAGRFFGCVLDCVSMNFSFSSIVSLLINRNLPWKETSKIDELVSFGIENNCLYSWTEETNGREDLINVWNEAFSSPARNYDSALKTFFESLKNNLLSMRSASSFSELRRQYFIFRSRFFDMEKCSQETDLILSRCITELINLCEIEKKFPEGDTGDFTIDHFSFFTDYLTEIFYLARSETSGVAILPYKAAAAAPFDCHIVLGSDQENLSVINSHLNFLPEKKRKELSVKDEDASGIFIDLHKYNSVKASAFFCSEQNFTEYTIPHSKIGFPSEPKDNFSEIPELNEKFLSDHYKEEISFFSDVNAPASLQLHENQITGFTEWKNRCSVNTPYSKNRNVSEKTLGIIRSCYEKNGKYNVSASSLKTYFQCSLKWLFERVLKLENTLTETSLMQENISGDIFHAVLNTFFIKLKGELLLEPVIDDFNVSFPLNYKELLEKSIEKVFTDFPLINTDRPYQISFLTNRLLNAQRTNIHYILENFLISFISFFANCRVTASEIFYNTEKDSYLLNGKADCILEKTINDKEKEYIIVDFKLKNTPPREECTGISGGELSDFQLPMYITLAEENEKFKVSAALFFSILDKKPQVIFGTINDSFTGTTRPYRKTDIINRNDDCYKKIFNEFNLKSKLFSQEIKTGDFTIFESKNSKCFSCRSMRICRTAYAVNREYLYSTGFNK